MKKSRSSVEIRQNFIETLIADVQHFLDKESTLHDFVALYLETIPARSLLEYTPKEWASFISDRYEYLKTAHSKPNGMFRIFSVDKTHYVFEYVCPDAYFLMLTFEQLFRSLDLKITQMFHPIMNIQANEKGDISKIFQSFTSKTGLTSLGYIEFQSAMEENTIKLLKEKIEYHMMATLEVNADFNNMLHKLTDLKDEMLSHDVSISESKAEWLNLLDWLKRENFSFFGYGEFDTPSSGKRDDLKIRKNSGLGILSDPFVKRFSTPLNTLMDHIWRKRRASSDFTFDLIHHISPIQRFEKLMRLSIKLPTEEKGVYRECVFLGILRQSSLFAKNIETPLIHLKMKHIFKQRNMLKGSYNYNEVIRIFTSIPKFELFRRDHQFLITMVDDLLSITHPNDVYCFSQSIDKQTISLLVVFPTNTFSAQNVQAVKQYVEHSVSFVSYECIEMPSEEHPRLQFYFDLHAASQEEIDIHKLEDAIRDLVTPWVDRLRAALYTHHDASRAIELFYKYAKALPEHYRIRRSAEDAVRDIEKLEDLSDETPIKFSLVPFQYHQSLISGKATLLTIYHRSKIELIDIMPILENMGFHVYDELASKVGDTAGAQAYMHNFRFVAAHNKEQVNTEAEKDGLCDLLENVFVGRTENDALNRLALLAKLGWRAINLLICYRNLLSQITNFSKESVNTAFLTHPDASALLFEYFEAKFSPHSKTTTDVRSATVLPKIKQAFLDTLAGVDDVNSDLIFRRMMNLMEATLRSNYYISAQHNRTRISIKLDSSMINQLPLPVPYREIYVHDVNMEGCHLRFGPASRGGLRWSNRNDDFRTEILSLVKTQQSKNVVIVPVGSKGGFIVKNLPKDKNEAFETAQREYREFIRSLLDITDTFDVDGNIVHPENIVFYDEPDPYLVVAADKGTASFSDIANGVSKEFGFWLGDAFASGGSNGYNHKEVGITARGAWECMKLHFKEGFGKDIQTQEFTVAGIGDMSGDVFGNGMLLSKCILLQAAFNHIHIFIDPAPNAAASFKERQRLYDLAGSTWEDYNKKLISNGGGVFSRKAKAITPSKEMMKLLGLKNDTPLTGEELISAILKMNVDLLWFGGIGTYIKALTETNLSVGDPANDAVRINASECKARVIGEGANLGMTQDARIQLGTHGHLMNTDAIDNSAGVNMSDYEVNIKILLDRLTRKGVIKTAKSRNQILADMTEDVAALCMRNNRRQHRLMSIDAKRSQNQFNRFLRLIDFLVESKLLNAKSERIPEHPELRELFIKHKQIPRPILAILQAYNKMWVFDSLLDTDLIQDAALTPFYTSYFPPQLIKKFGKEVENHHLKKEILCTSLSNKIINQAGSTFYHHVHQLTGKPLSEITKAYLIIDSSLNGDDIRRAIFSASVTEADRYDALISLETMIQSCTRDLLTIHKVPYSTELIKTFAEIFSKLDEVLNKTPDIFTSEAGKWQKIGFSKDTADRLSRLAYKQAAVDIFQLHQNENISVPTALQLIQLLDPILELDSIQKRLNQITIENHWDMSQKDILEQHLRIQRINAVNQLVKLDNPKLIKSPTKQDVMSALEGLYQGELALYFDTLKSLKKRTSPDLTSLTVVVNRLQL